MPMQAYADLEALMSVTEQVLRHVVRRTRSSRRSGEPHSTQEKEANDLCLPVNTWRFMGRDAAARRRELDAKFGPLTRMSTAAARDEHARAEDQPTDVIDWNQPFARVSIPDVLEQRLGEPLPLGDGPGTSL